MIAWRLLWGWAFVRLWAWVTPQYQNCRGASLCNVSQWNPIILMGMKMGFQLLISVHEGTTLYLKKWLPWRLLWRLLGHEKHVYRNFCSSNCLSSSLLHGLEDSFLHHFPFKHFMDYLTTLVGTLSRVPKALFIGDKSTISLSTFICHFERERHTHTHPLPLWGFTQCELFRLLGSKFHLCLILLHISSVT